MVSQLKLAGNYVFGGTFGHLQIVGVDGSNLWEIEVQSGFSEWDVVGIDSLRDHTDTPHYGVPGSYGSINLSIGDRSADDVWEMFRQAAADFEAANLDYNLLSQNSNTFAYSMLLTADVSAYADIAVLDVAQASGLEFNAIWDARSLVRFTIDGTSGVDWFYSGAQNDVLAGGDGADILFGGDGSDIIIIGNIDGNNEPLDDTDPPPDPPSEETINGGAGEDYLVVTSGTAGIVRIDAADSEAKIDKLLVHAKMAGVEGASDYQLLKLVGGVYASVALLLDGTHAAEDYNYNMNRTIDENGNEWQIYHQYTEPYNAQSSTLPDPHIIYSYCPSLHQLEIGVSDGEEFYQTIIVENFNEGDLGITFQGVLLSHGILEEGEFVGSTYPPPDQGFVDVIESYFIGASAAMSAYSLKEDGTFAQSSMMMLSSETLTADNLMMALDGGDNADQLAGLDMSEIISGHDGNDILIGNGGDDLISGNADDDTVDGGSGADVMDGGDGVDIATYSNSSAAIIINLALGTGLGGEAEGDTLIGFENVVGSDFVDKLTGDAGDNRLEGGAGNDVLIGSLGADTLVGDDGDQDVADYGNASAGVLLNLVSGGTGGEASGDTYSSIEYVYGSDFYDDITGDAAINRLIGGIGNDVLNGAGGNDVLVGGLGSDTLVGGSGDQDVAGYQDAGSGVVVNLVSGGTGGEASGDTYSGIEYVYGSAYADQITGDGVINRLTGGAGNDTLDGAGGNDVLVGGEGADTLVGGSGTQDAASYQDAAAAVTVNLVTGGTAGEASGDTYSGIEYAYGSAYADQITGDGAVNRLTGGAGDDTLDGVGGNDILLGGGGADSLVGGSGTQDAASYQDALIGVIVSLALGGTGGEANGDAYSGIEYVYGSAYADQIAGDGAINRLAGGAGNDILDGAAGNDYLLGNTGDDTLIGGLGADVFVFETGLGNDTISDFWIGTGLTDRVWFTALGFDDFTDVQANALDSAAGVVITLAGEGTLTFTGVTLAQLNADDFIFT